MTDEHVEQPGGLPAREPGNAPEGEPGNAWVTPKVERPPRRQPGVVSDPDQYADGSPARDAEGPRTRGTGTASDPGR